MPPKVRPALVPLTLIVVTVAAWARVVATVTLASPNVAIRAAGTMMCKTRRGMAIANAPFSCSVLSPFGHGVPASSRAVAGRWPGVGRLGRKVGVKATAIRASRPAADDDGMTAIELAAAGGVICAAGIALYAGLKVRRRAPVVTWRAWSEAFPVRAVSWTLAVGVTLSILAGAAAVIDARIAGPGHRPRGSPGNDVAWPERMSLPELTAGPTSHPRHHRRGDARPGSPAASSPCPTAYPAPTL